MNTLVVIMGSIVGLIGCFVAVWSVIDTRKKHYKDYLNNKRGKL